MMKQMVLGEGRASLNLSDTTGLADCLEAVHHRGQPRQLLLAFPKEVLILDTEIGTSTNNTYIIVVIVRTIGKCAVTI